MSSYGRPSSSLPSGNIRCSCVFSIDHPTLKLNKLKSTSEKDQQVGFMQILAGCMTGIRNPRAHEHRHFDEPNAALEMLALANHLMRLVGNATRSRSRK